ncbi:MAG TPA: serine hydrolase domain-containing protein [Longimicrobium sp.]|nr:serine hydrolase domain-containing protein [Longimicrobium sp.]
MRIRFPRALQASLVALCAAAASGCGQVPAGRGPASPPGGSGGDVVVREEAASVAEFLRRQSGFGYSGSVLIVRGDTVLLRAAYGLADAERRIRYHPGTVFDIGSLAKQFTAAAILRLEMDGRLAVGDSIGRYLPGVPPDKRGITIHQLLTHTSGLASDYPYASSQAARAEYEVVGRDSAVRRILASRLDSPPGGAFSYSNPGYVLLAAIVERAAGQSYNDYLRTRLFRPAGMTSTGFWGDLPGVPDSLVARGHDELGRVVHDPLRRSPDTWFDRGGGMVLSTLSDLARWMAALRAGRVLSPRAAAKLFHPWVANTYPYPPTAAYGYGWNLGPPGPDGAASVHHGGDYLGTGAQLLLLPRERLLMVTSTNVRHDLYPTRNRVDRVIPRILAGETVPFPPAFPALDSAAATDTGRYRLPTGGRVVVRLERGRMYVGAEGQDAVDLLTRAPDSLRAVRAELSRAARALLEGAWAGDFEPLRGHAQGPVSELGKGIQDYLREIAPDGAPLERVEVLGTYASGFPVRGSREKTLMRLHYRGAVLPFFIHWAGRTLMEADTTARGLPARIPLQRAAGDRYVGWEIVETTPVELTFSRSGGRAAAVRIQRDSSIATALRETP